MYCSLDEKNNTYDILVNIKVESYIEHKYSELRRNS